MKILVCLFLVITMSQLHAQFPASCDADKSCVGLAYTGTVSTGKGANYIEVEKTKAQDSLTTAMSVEFWINPTRQAGTRVYLGGKWGPFTNTDNNDSWALYISPSDELVFELNGQGDNLGPTDNTVAKTSATPLYGVWTHLCVIFDGSTQSAIIYLNAKEVARTRNASYALNTLRVPSDRSLKILFGSTNDIARSSSFRTFIGQLDEIRIWKRVLTPLEIYCNMERPLAGNESGLILYYRCNDNNTGGTSGQLCDATGRGAVGRMVQVQVCAASTRTVKQKIITDITNINDQVRCDTTKSWQINVTDTSYQSCNNSYTFSIAGADAKYFKVTPANAILSPNTPLGLNLKFSGLISGAIKAQLVITPANRCVPVTRIDIDLVRSTEVEIKKRSMRFDTLYAKCISTPYHDSVIVVCNNTGPTGTNTNRTVTIRGGSVSLYGAQFQLFPPAGKSFPFDLAIGECASLRLRFSTTIDTTFNYFDTLRIASDDRCLGSASINISGVIQEVFSIRDPGGKTRLKSLQFGATCPEDISNSIAWNWYNLTRRNLIIDSIRIPSTIVTVGMPKAPPAYTLRPSASFGEFQKYFRFKPKVPGTISNDPIIYYAHLEGFNCQFVDTLKWTGRGLDNDVVFSTVSVNYGNVIVGKDSVIAITFTNQSTTDVMNISFYLKKGDVFLFTGANSASLQPGQSKTINLTFRPTEDIQYFDELCLFEQRCYTTQCIPVTGRGVIERFRFDPIVMKILNVIGCRDSMSFVDVINESTVDQTIRNIGLVQNGTEFSPVDINGAPFSLAGFSVTLKPGQRQRFYFRFLPNNNTQDLAKVAYLSYTTSLSSDKWQVKLFATSVIPRLYITPLRIYGTIEVGDTRRDSVTLENASPLPILVDTVIIPNGYTLVSMNKTLPRILQPRDSVTMVVDFTPKVDGVYNLKVVAKGSAPCPQIQIEGDLRGKTFIVPLDASLSITNFSYVRPCDCIVRHIPLSNNSFINGMTIDSMWIDTNNVKAGTPSLFKWTSYYYEQGGKTLPYVIPPRTTDTVHLIFCPRTPSEAKFINCAARFNINAHGVGWGPSKFNCFLAGRRSLMFRPYITQIGFPGTRVDTLSIPRRDTIGIPTETDNPGQDTVQIDSITYLPDERVFSHTDTLGNPISFPVTIKPKAKAFPFRFYFKPRAPRQGVRKYQARAVLHYSRPCRDIDTTILLTGEGLAPAYGLQLTFDNNRTGQDTFRIISCDTLHVPVYCSRDIPAPTVDIQYDAVYDTTKLKFVGATTVFSSTSDISSPMGGRRVVVKNCRNLDSLMPFVTMHFVPTPKVRMTTALSLDSIFFDTSEILNYYLSAGGDNATVVVDQAEIKVQKPLIDFDSVRVLDCLRDSVVVLNTGDVPLTVDSILILPPQVRYISSTPSRNTLLNPGQGSTVVVEYCPRNNTSFDSLMYTVCSIPCRLDDSLKIMGRGYVPSLPIRFSTDNINFSAPAPRGGIISDTITIPLYLDSNLSTTYHNTTYWLQDLHFAIGVNWNKYMLKYLDASSVFGKKLTITHPRYDSLNLQFSSMDSVQAGKIADMRFVILVPDTTADQLRITPDTVFKTDSLLFLKLIPKGSSTQIQTGAKCNTTSARVNVMTPLLYQSQPNPASTKVNIRFDIQETVPVLLVVYNSTGELVETLLDGNTTLAGGQHNTEFDLSRLPAGVYSYALHAGVFSDAKQLVIVR